MVAFWCVQGVIEAKYFDSILQLMCLYWEINSIWLWYIDVQGVHIVLFSGWCLDYDFMRSIWNVVLCFETGTSIWSFLHEEEQRTLDCF